MASWGEPRDIGSQSGPSSVASWGELRDIGSQSGPGGRDEGRPLHQVIPVSFMAGQNCDTRVDHEAKSAEERKQNASSSSEAPDDHGETVWFLGSPDWEKPHGSSRADPFPSSECWCGPWDHEGFWTSSFKANGRQAETVPWSVRAMSRRVVPMAQAALRTRTRSCMRNPGPNRPAQTKATRAAFVGVEEILAAQMVGSRCQQKRIHAKQTEKLFRREKPSWKEKPCARVRVWDEVL